MAEDEQSILVDAAEEQRDADRATMARLAADNRQLSEQLRAVQARCTELLELNRALDQRARVREFMDRSHQPYRVTPGKIPEGLLGFRISLLAEEFCELLDACGVDTTDAKYVLKRDISTLSAPTDTAHYMNVVALVDALADIAYVTEGFYRTIGVDSAPIAAEVHRSNWEKVCRGIKKHPETGKVMKPDGWRPPDIAGELKKQGWREDE